MKRTNFRKTLLAAAIGVAAVVGVAAFADAHGGGWGGFGTGGGMMGSDGGYGPGMMGGGYDPQAGYGPGTMRGYGPRGPNPGYAPGPSDQQLPERDRNQ
jgi:hypothetical protein